MKFRDLLNEGEIISFKKGETIQPKLFIDKKPFGKDLVVIIKRSDKSNQDSAGMYLVNKKGKVIHNLGSHPSISVLDKLDDNSIKKFIAAAKDLREGVETVLKDVQHQVKTFDKPETGKLFKTKVINAMKEKRNKIKNSKIKKQYQDVIDRLEKEI